MSNSSIAKLNNHFPAENPGPELSLVPEAKFEPAGFWIRLLATAVDGMILNLIVFPIAFAVGFFIGLNSITENSDQVMNLIGYAIQFAVAIPYFLYFYTQRAATPGKLIFNLRVVNQTTGEYLSPKQIIARDIIGKFLGMVPFFGGFILAGFRKDKRALHDFIAGSVVVRKTSK